MDENAQKRVFYSSTLSEFMELEENEFVLLMEQGSLECGYSVGDSEKTSWKENFKALRALFIEAKLPHDIFIAFEYLIPIGGGRIDCMLFGHKNDGSANIIHIELKQWSNENVTPYYDNYTFVVDGYRSGCNYVSHPLEQVSGYQNILLNHIKCFEKDNIHLIGFAYCYNMSSHSNVLLDENYFLSTDYKLFCGDQKNDFACRLGDLLNNGKGEDVYKSFANSEIGTTKRLYDVAGRMLDGSNEFNLIGDQVDVFNSILGAVKNTPKDQKTAIIVKGGPGTGKSVIAMRLLAELYKEEYNCQNVFYATRSASLRDGWKEALKNVARQYNRGEASSLIQSTYDFKPFRYNNVENGGDVLIVDEAHRISYKSNDQTDSHRDDQDRSYLPQILSMLYTSRVCVFFIDDKQSIVPTEIGFSKNIEEAAIHYQEYIIQAGKVFNGDIKNPSVSIFKDIPIRKKYENEKTNLENNLEKEKTKGHYEKVQNIEKNIRRVERMISLPILKPCIEQVHVLSFELRDQFRCNGSTNYLNWIDKVLYNNEGEQIKLNTDSYEFAIYDTPQELYAKIRSLDSYARVADQIKEEMGDLFTYKGLAERTNHMNFNQSARIVAGWCWDWNTKENPQVDKETGDLRKEVDIKEYNFALPWETQQKPHGDYSFKYAKDAESWCNQKEGVNQVGCIHSIQGWETDYIGVIIGPDLQWDEKENRLCYNPKGNNHNLTAKATEENNRLILNTYRVLLTRGKKGCFVFACDPKVKEYLKKCLEGGC